MLNSVSCEYNQKTTKQKYKKAKTKTKAKTKQKTKNKKKKRPFFRLKQVNTLLT